MKHKRCPVAAGIDAEPSDAHLSPDHHGLSPNRPIGHGTNAWLWSSNSVLEMPIPAIPAER